MDDVLVGVDGSEASMVALDWAAATAAAVGGRLAVAQAHEQQRRLPFGPSDPTTDEADVDETRADLARLVTARLDGGDGPASPAVAVDLEVLEGEPGEALRGWAERVEPLALVVGRAGQGGLSTLGSVGRSLVEQPPAPLVVVPDAAGATLRLGLDGTIVVGVDDRPGSHAALAWAARLADALDASVLALHAFDPRYAETPPDKADELRAEAEGAVEVARRFLPEDQASRVRTELVEGEPQDQLAAAAERHGAALLVVSDVGRRGPGSMLGSVATHLVAHSAVPVAVVPSPA